MSAATPEVALKQDMGRIRGQLNIPDAGTILRNMSASTYMAASEVK